jgi:TolB protein
MRKRALITVLALVLTSALAGTAGAAGRPSHGSGGFLPRAQVPWSSVGPGWLLAQWSTKAHPYQTGGLVLVSPAGTRYLLTSTAPGALESWSGDGRRALLVQTAPSVGAGRTTFSVVDLETGATLHAFLFATSNQILGPAGAFTRPDGFALYVEEQYNNYQRLTRYAVDGMLEQVYPQAFPGLGRYSGRYVSSPDGASLVLGATRGLAVVANDGTLVRRLPIAGTNYCNPVRWWTRDVVLASCGTPSRLYEFPTSGGTPRALTERPVPPDAGDLAAWHVDRSVFVQVASACGYVYLAKLAGAHPEMVRVPGVPSGHTVLVDGATATALALSANVACQGGPSLLWYWPAGNHAKFLLGAPATGGSVEAALTYPTPLG